ncbi:MAG: hypothetical protein L0H26_11190 [Microlunatus sp.]|nr:hypothetical protein [Microlunatus sp.]
MSVVAVALVLGLLVALLIKWKIVRGFGALVCILFGLVLAATPIGEGVLDVVTSIGDFAAAQVGRL